MLAAFFAILQERADLAGEHRQLTAGKLQRLRTGRIEEGPIVADNQGRFVEISKKMLEQDLGPQVQEVRRLVQHQQVGVVQQQRRQLDSGLPSTRKLFDRPLQIRSLQLKLTCDLSTSPFRLVAVPHQKIERRLSCLKGIVLTQVTDSQRWVVDDFPLFQLLIPKQNPQQR